MKQAVGDTIVKNPYSEIIETAMTANLAGFNRELRKMQPHLLSIDDMMSVQKNISELGIGIAFDFNAALENWYTKGDKKKQEDWKDLVDRCALLAGRQFQYRQSQIHRRIKENLLAVSEYLS